jgi:glycosyltransferase involved in cell wall biosynthesis
MMKMEKRLLLLCYYFPPAPLALAQRVAKLCKYLPRETGWIPQVICGELTLDVPGLDNSLLSELSEILGVERVGGYLSSNLARQLKAWHLDKPMRLWRKLTVRPDAYGDWIETAVTAAEKKFPGGKGFQVILASGPPNSVYVVGARLSERWNVPLVIDMRDPWSQIWGKPHWFISWCSRQSEPIEQEAYQKSAAIITNTPGNLRDLRRRFPQYTEKIEMIPNGFDPEDLDREQGPHLCGNGESREVVHLLYLGGLRGRGYEEPFLRVLADYLAEHPEERHGLRVHFVGGTLPQVEALVQPFGLKDICQAHGIVPGNAVGRPLAEADIYVLLLPHGNCDSVPAKSYYYLAGGKYIFAMVRDGSTQKLLSELKDLAVIADYADEKAGKIALAKIVTQARSSKGTRTEKEFPPYALPYDRRTIARQVGAVLDKVVADSKK